MFFRDGWELEVEVLAACRSTSIILKSFDFFCDGYFFYYLRQSKLKKNSADCRPTTKKCSKTNFSRSTQSEDAQHALQCAGITYTSYLMVWLGLLSLGTDLEYFFVVSADHRPTVGRRRPTIGRQSADSRPTKQKSTLNPYPVIGDRAKPSGMKCV